ncbi:MAG: TetR/AcrR family transcriptional regulator [Acidimicrobiales bacterium]
MANAQVDEPIDEPGSAAWWHAHAERLQRRRPRAGGLTVERLVDAALELVARDGLDALTVRSLASSLGTSSATLYRHVASIEELLVLMVDRVLGGIDLLDDERPARERVTHISWEFRRVLLEHPGIVPALRASPLLGPNAMRGAEAGLAGFLAMGFDDDVAVRGYLALIDYVLGSVFFDTASGGERNARAASTSTRTSPDTVLATHSAAIRSASSDEVFGLGVESFLDGLERHRTR